MSQTSMHTELSPVSTLTTADYPRRMPRSTRSRVGWLRTSARAALAAALIGCASTTGAPPVEVPPPRENLAQAQPATSPVTAEEPDWDIGQVPTPDAEPVTPLPERPVVLPPRREEPRLSGAISTPVIRSVIRREVPAIRSCYQESPSAAIEQLVAIRFVIEADGSVANVEIVRRDGPEDPAFDACLGGVMQSLVFPTMPGGGQVIVTYPFRFIPEGAGSPPE